VTAAALKTRRRPSAAGTAAPMKTVSPPERAGIRFISRSPAETRRLAERLGRLLKGGEVFALSGDLGAGKTCFIQGLAKGVGVRESYLPSPTFIFLQRYEGRLTLYHADLYRIERPSDAEGLGLLECFDEKSVVAVEWAEKAIDYLPESRITIKIENRGEKERRLEFDVPAEYEYMIKKLK
jgi:tRNA threonylcarbamoyladenosine biosynthesis protein TsaE